MCILSWAGRGLDAWFAMILKARSCSQLRENFLIDSSIKEWPDLHDMLSEDMIYRLLLQYCWLLQSLRKQLTHYFLSLSPTAIVYILLSPFSIPRQPSFSAAC